MLKPINYLIINNPTIDRAFQLLTKTVNQLLSKHLLDYVILSFDLTTGSNECEHKLNRDVEGWVIIDISTDAKIYKSASDKFKLTLVTDKNVTIKILIF